MNKTGSSTKLIWPFYISSFLSLLIIISLTGLGVHKIFSIHNINNAELTAVTIGQILSEQQGNLLFSLDSKRQKNINVMADDIKELDKYIQQYLSLFDIVKIKVFSRDKTIVYSTDHSIIGKKDVHNEKLKMALNGEVVSKHEKEDKIWDLKGEQRYDVDLVETYMPIRDDNSEVVGSFEIYRDIGHFQTEKLNFLISSLLLIAIILISTFSVLFVFIRKMTFKLFKSEESLKESEERFRTVAENANDAIISVDRNGKIIFWNYTAEIIFGYSSEEILGRQPTFLMPERYREDHEKAFNRVSSTGKSNIIGKKVVMFGLRKSGEEFPLELTLSLGTVKEETFFNAIIRDVTAQKIAVEKIKASEEKYRMLFSSEQDAVILVDAETHKIIDANDSALILYGYSMEEILKLNGPDLSEEPEKSSVAIKEIAESSKKQIHFHTRNHKKKDGTVFPVEISSGTFALKDRRIVSAVIRDVTDKQQAEESLKKSSFYLDNVSDSMIVLNAKQEVIRVNNEFSNLWGYSPDEILGKPISILFPKEEMKKHSLEMETAATTRKPRYFETTALTKSKGKIPLSIRVSAIFNSNGKLDGFIGIFRDITERMIHEKTISNQLHRLNALRSIDKAIIGSIDLRVILDIFLEQVIKQLTIDAASVLLLDKRSQILEYVNSKGFRTDALKYTKLRLGESNAGRAAIDRRIVIIPDLNQTPVGFEHSKLFDGENFVTYIGVPLIAKGQVMGVLELFSRTAMTPSPEWMDFLEAIADQGALAIDNATLFEELQRSSLEVILAYDSTIEGWSLAMDMRDKETEGHSQRVTELTILIARELGIKEEDIVHLRRGALLHDMGKMGIPDSILLKPGKLDENEWKIMKQHPIFAYELLSKVDYLRPSLDIPYCHHEKWDGTGYPRGLKGEAIPLGARIFALVDVWDALRSDRPYRPAWSREKTLEHIKAQSGTHFDPQVVEVFLKIESTI